MDCKVFPFMTSNSCTEPPNEKRFETYRRKNETLNWILLYLRSTWNFPFKDECANLMSSSTLGIHGFVDLIFSIKITRIILSGNKKGLFVFTFSVITAGSYYAGKGKWHHTACVILPRAQPNLRWNFQAQPPESRAPLEAMAQQFLGWGLGAGLFPQQSCSPMGQLGLWHSFRFCCWAASAALPVATAPWDAKRVIFIIFSQLDTCVCAPWMCTTVPVPTAGLQKANCSLQDEILPPPWQPCRVVTTVLLAGEEVLLLSSSISSAVATSEKE